MLPIYAPWCGLEAYQRGVTVANYFWRKWEQSCKVSLWKVKVIYLPLISFFWVTVPCRGVLCSVNSMYFDLV